jgi:putative ABC transport system ATP-binding protein
MVTHNMETALDYGNKLIMMHKGRIILDIGKEEKRHSLSMIW